MRFTAALRSSCTHSPLPTPEVMKNSHGVFVPAAGSAASELHPGLLTVATPHRVYFLTGK